MRAHETNMLEIKTMAGFINYKVTTVLLVFDNCYLKEKRWCAFNGERLWSSVLYCFHRDGLERVIIRAPTVLRLAETSEFHTKERSLSEVWDYLEGFEFIWDAVFWQTRHQLSLCAGRMNTRAAFSINVFVFLQSLGRYSSVTVRGKKVTLRISPYFCGILRAFR